VSSLEKNEMEKIQSKAILCEIEKEISYSLSCKLSSFTFPAKNINFPKFLNSFILCTLNN
jgi:hypothetical protein